MSLKKTIQSKHYLHYSFQLKKDLISIEKIHSIKNVSYIRKKIQLKHSSFQIMIIIIILLWSTTSADEV